MLVECIEDIASSNVTHLKTSTASQKVMMAMNVIFLLSFFLHGMYRKICINAWTARPASLSSAQQ